MEELQELGISKNEELQGFDLGRIYGRAKSVTTQVSFPKSSS
jgi:hypothetical protein